VLLEIRSSLATLVRCPASRDRCADGVALDGVKIRTVADSAGRGGVSRSGPKKAISSEAVLP